MALQSPDTLLFADTDGSALPISATNPLPVYFPNGIPVQFTTVPASATATGARGQMAYGSGYLYVCVATNTWRRTALTTF